MRGLWKMGAAKEWVNPNNAIASHSGLRLFSQFQIILQFIFRLVAKIRASLIYLLSGVVYILYMQI